MNKRQFKGRIDQVMGHVKQVIGKAVGNKELEQKGRKQKAGGKAQSGHGDRKERIEDSIRAESPHCLGLPRPHRTSERYAHLAPEYV